LNLKPVFWTLPEVKVVEMIVTKGLGKIFRSGNNTVEAVKNVNLQVGQGQIFGFLGPNGAGKTTTMRMLTTLKKQPSKYSRSEVIHFFLRGIIKNIWNSRR
jgi:ABC-type multidrug transport system, ATPase component